MGHDTTITSDMKRTKGSFSSTLFANMLGSFIATQVDSIFGDRVRRKQGDLKPRSCSPSLLAELRLFELVESCELSEGGMLSLLLIFFFWFVVFEERKKSGISSRADQRFFGEKGLLKFIESLKLFEGVLLLCPEALFFCCLEEKTG